MKNLGKHVATKKHVIWDWNGTLLQDLELAVNVTNRLLREENLPPLSRDRYREIFRFPVINYYRELGLDTSPEKFTELCERFNAHFHDDLKTCDLWAGARETLREIKAQNKLQSLLSATEQNLLEASVDTFAVRPYFDHVFGIADKAAASKVSRGHDLMKIAGVPKADTVMIGDTDHDLEVGQALGIDVILVEHGHQHPERLRRAHHTVLKIFA